MAGVRLESPSDLKRKLEERRESVITFLCENPSDMELLGKNLEKLSIEHVLYCPPAPYNHKPSVINGFFEKVDKQGKGTLELNFCGSKSNSLQET